MPSEAIVIEASDGACPAQVFTPVGDGKHPAVIFCMDGFGIRPGIEQMAQRLADAGYVVLLPDLFYRAGPYGPLVPSEVFATIAHLDGRDDVAGTKIGTTGYCMGGGIALSIAGTYPDRIGAAASFHGGMLATDDPNSPHLLAPSIAARVYVGGADQDDFYPAEMAERLEHSLTVAGVDHRCEIYAGALHGFTMKDFPVYDEAASERHWRELLALYAAKLG